jgi:hypothetical protein
VAADLSFKGNDSFFDVNVDGILYCTDWAGDSRRGTAKCDATGEEWNKLYCMYEDSQE